MWRCWISPGDNPAPVRALMGPGPVAGLERNRVAPIRESSKTLSRLTEVLLS
jgi:hypothetical protein